MTQLALSRHWNPKEIGANVREGMDLLAREEKADRAKASFFHVLIQLPAEGEARLKVCLSASRSESKACVFLRDPCQRF